MIDEMQAVQIATDYREGDQPVEVQANAAMFVVTFQGTDPYANLPVAVDRATGQPQSLGANEYVDISDTLQSVPLPR